jgi:multidrug transporter EmrE-like cation transporter
MKADTTIKLLTAIMWTSFGLAALTMFSYMWFPQEAAWRGLLVPILILAQCFARVFRVGYQHEMGIRR